MLNITFDLDALSLSHLPVFKNEEDDYFDQSLDAQDYGVATKECGDWD